MVPPLSNEVAVPLPAGFGNPRHVLMVAQGAGNGWRITCTNALDTHVYVMHDAPMTLADYLAAHGLSDADFAVRVGVSRPQINRLRNGQTWISDDVAARIFDATDGQVTPNDFLATRRASVDAEPDAA